MKDLAPFVEARLSARLREALEADGVHPARLAIKKARAALRVLRPALGAKEFKRRDALLREANHRLSLVRDAEVLVVTASDLHAGTPSAVRELERRAKKAESRRSAREEARSFLAHALSSARPSPLSPEDFADAVRRDYKRARRRFRQAVADRDDEAFHGWRRAAKVVRYELALLEEPPAALEKLAEALKKLGDALGEDHDEAVLVETLAREPLAFGEKPAVDRLVGRARRAQGSARARALRLADHAFGSRPKQIARRVRAALSRRLG